MDTTDVNVVHYDLTDTGRMTPSAGKRLFVDSLTFLDKESSVFASGEPLRIKIDWHVFQHFDAVNMKLNFHYRDSTPIGITHPITLGSAEAGHQYSTVFTVDTSIFSEGQYFFYLDVFERELANAACLDKPNQEFAFEITNQDRTLPEWSSGWGHIHFPPVVVEHTEVN